MGGTKDLRVRQSALNSIAQGDVPWLPGFGPVSTMATTELLGQILPKDLVLDLVGTDNELGKGLLQSMYLGGQVPRATPQDILASTLPAWAKNLAKDTLGDNLAANVSYIVNQRYIDSQKNGTPFNQQQAFEEAKSQARAAGIVRLVSGGVLGLSGKASVDGQFYVEQMHQLQALTPEQLKAQGFPNAQAAFSSKFPEAARLNWSVSKNETGINASVSAAKSANRQSGLIDANPALGWFIVGADNIGGKFSQTAYDAQADNSYGIAQLSRKKETPEETANRTFVQQGWDRYSKITAGLAEAEKTSGMTSTQVSAVKKVMVDRIASSNPEWFAQFNQRDNKLATFFQAADAIAAKPEMKGREDMNLYQQYRGARQQIMDIFGIKALTGTSANAIAARTAVATIGEKFGAQNVGFQQMWDRMLSGEIINKTTGEVKN